ncbi:hypothetical protein OIU85_006759 [Salix viminalis]|uniref:Uncharacterized protein n=1 Tax=Salix viminalis TaxID=40686 RepID=A0A9Q0PMC9_SALVM|nr:hypothetical protein OIU85_006759 [Salix viminalis]
MALNSSSPGSTTSLSSIAFRSNNPRNPPTCKHFFQNFSSPVTESLRVSADSTPKAKFVARRKESVSVRQLGRPLSGSGVYEFASESVLSAGCGEDREESKSSLMVVALSFCPVSLKARRLWLHRMRSLTVRHSV